jgi:hypothetical protein
MKPKTLPEFIGHLIGFLGLSALFGLWFQWIFGSYFQSIEWWKCFLIWLGVSITTPSKLFWVFTLLLLISTAGIWFGFAN